MPIGQAHAYPETCDLPFNRTSLETHFQLSSPDQDPGGEGVWLLFCGTQLLAASGENGPQLPSGECLLPDATTTPLYIGNWLGRPCRLLVATDPAQIPPELQSHSLRTGEEQLPLALLSLAGLGLMIQHWEASSRFCGHCGTALIRLPTGWGKVCPACNSHHFPRIHPCVIGLVVKGDEILLVRKAEWPAGRHGLVAGFVEFGESQEQAMSREIAEETGLKVNNLRYVGSQCWPFPSQIMNGFVADYVSGEIQLEDEELEAAAWYKLDQLPTIPPQRSIARYLIDEAAKYLQEKKR